MGSLGSHDHAEDHNQCAHQGTPDRTHPEEVRLVANSEPPKETVEEHREGRKNGDQPDQNFHSARTSLVTGNSSEGSQTAQLLLPTTVPS